MKIVLYAYIRIYVYIYIYIRIYKYRYIYVYIVPPTTSCVRPLIPPATKGQELEFPTLTFAPKQIRSFDETWLRTDVDPPLRTEMQFIRYLETRNCGQNLQNVARNPKSWPETSDIKLRFEGLRVDG